MLEHGVLHFIKQTGTTLQKQQVSWFLCYTHLFAWKHSLKHLLLQTPLFSPTAFAVYSSKLGHLGHLVWRNLTWSWAAQASMSLLPRFTRIALTCRFACHKTRFQRNLCTSFLLCSLTSVSVGFGAGGLKCRSIRRSDKRKIYASPRLGFDKIFQSTVLFLE